MGLSVSPLPYASALALYSIVPSRELPLDAVVATPKSCSLHFSDLELVGRPWQTVRRWRRHSSATRGCVNDQLKACCRDDALIWQRMRRPQRSGEEAGEEWVTVGRLCVVDQAVLAREMVGYS